MLPGKFLRSLGLSSMDLQFVVNNVAVWSPVKLWDPEQSEYNGGAYPIPRTFSLQLYVNF